MTQLPPHSVTDLLVLSYVQLRDAWVKAHQVQDCSTDAPWHQWRDVPEDAPITLRDVLMDFGEKSGSLAARAVGQHLDLLARAYWLDPAAPDGPEWDRWPYAAAYGPARAILESAALAGWLLDPDPDPDERALRGARLALWSRAIDWEDDLRSAGFDVRRNDNDTPYVWSDGSSRPLSLSALVRYVFSRRGTRLYGRWSKQLHNDPVAIAPRSTLRVEDDGLHLGSIIREDEHIELAVDVADMLLVAGQRQAAYFGRTVEPIGHACHQVAGCLRSCADPPHPVLGPFFRAK